MLLEIYLVFRDCPGLDKNCFHLISRQLSLEGVLVSQTHPPPPPSAQLYGVDWQIRLVCNVFESSRPCGSSAGRCPGPEPGADPGATAMQCSGALLSLSGTFGVWARLGVWRR